MRKYSQVLSAVHMVYRLVNSTYNVQELSLRLTRLLCQFIKASSSSIYILEPRKTKILIVAMFDNRINMLLSKRKELERIPERKRKVTEGFAIFDKHLLGLPLVADDNVGAIFVQRKKHEWAFTDADREMLTVFAEQSVTAIKNLQFYEEQQKIILGSIEFIGKMLQKQGSHAASTTHTPTHFNIVKSLGEKLDIGKDGIDSLYYASILHDAGAMDVPYEILSKTSHLTPEEFKIIRTHPTQSFELIKPIEFLKPILPIILYHHEKYDGTGYPSGLKKEQIPLGARIMAVVDAFEAMIQERPYKKKLTIEEAIGELRQNSGSQFDPKVIDAFVELSKQRKFRNYLSLSKP